MLRTSVADAHENHHISPGAEAASSKTCSMGSPLPARHTCTTRYLQLGLQFQHILGLFSLSSPALQPRCHHVTPDNQPLRIKCWQLASRCPFGRLPSDVPQILKEAFVVRRNRVVILPSSLLIHTLPLPFELFRDRGQCFRTTGKETSDGYALPLVGTECESSPKLRD
jgi:hypothetical protein